MSNFQKTCDAWAILRRQDDKARSDIGVWSGGNSDIFFRAKKSIWGDSSGRAFFRAIGFSCTNFVQRCLVSLVTNENIEKNKSIWEFGREILRVPEIFDSMRL